MIVALIGTPSPLTYVATGVLRAIVQVNRGEHHMIGVNTIADLRAAWPEKQGRKAAVILASDMPDPSLLQFLTQAKVPLLFCIEPIETIADYMTGSRGLETASALRIGARALSGLEDLSADPPPSALRLGPSPTSLERVLGGLLRFCCGETDPGAVADVLAYLGSESRAAEPFSDFLAHGRNAMFPAGEGPRKVDQRLLDAVATVSRGYSGVASGQRLDDLLWPAPVFVLADTPGLPVLSDLELEGPARFLAHGPYFHLPPGRWEAEIALEVSESYSQNRVGFDVFCDEVLAACAATLPDEGAYACDMAFRIIDPSKPIEIRIQLLSGAIEGRLKLHGVRLRRR